MKLSTFLTNVLNDLGKYDRDLLPSEQSDLERMIKKIKLHDPINPSLSPQEDDDMSDGLGTKG